MALKPKIGISGKGLIICHLINKNLPLINMKSVTTKPLLKHLFLSNNKSTAFGCQKWDIILKKNAF